MCCWAIIIDKVPVIKKRGKFIYAKNPEAKKHTMNVPLKLYRDECLQASMTKNKGLFLHKVI
jgi:hypothetical protein